MRGLPPRSSFVSSISGFVEAVARILGEEKGGVGGTGGLLFRLGDMISWWVFGTGSDEESMFIFGWHKEEMGEVLRAQVAESNGPRLLPAAEGSSLLF